ncbi:hypothetical protein TNCV_92861 [Trichonephila clavipes]|nr:hypothetical protein TNCV_92861 [Trichonephila clavipes]
MFQQTTPLTVTPYVIAVYLSTTNAGSDRWPSRFTRYGLVISTDTESGFINEDHTPPVGHTPACPSQSSPSCSLDTNECLEGGKWRRTDSSDVVGKDMATLMIARSSRVFSSWDALSLLYGSLSLP